MKTPALTALAAKDKVVPLDKLTSTQLKELQTALHQLNLYPANQIDGEYGPLTQEGWRVFKKLNNQSSPQLVGAGSLKLLLNKTAAPAVSRQVEAVLDLAVTQLGVVESPSGSNRQKYGEWYGMNAVPWCAIFCSYVFDQAGYPLPVIQKGAPSGAAYCPYVEEYARRQLQWHQTPLPGDLALYSFGKKEAIHIGIVEKVKGNNFTAIEGNTSLTSNDNGGGVMRRSRNVKDCRGFYRPVLPYVAPIQRFNRLLRVTSPLMVGTDVKVWQRQMNFLGYSLDMDGVYGDASKRVCLDLQAKRKLPPTGQVDKVTWLESFERE